MTADEKKLLSTKEAALMLECTPSTVRDYIQRGILPSAQPGATGRYRRGGARHLIQRADVMKLLETTTKKPEPEETEQ